MKNKFINLYMDWAKRCAELSHAKRLHVGAVIVKDDTVISYGYNGMPAGWDNNCEDVEWCSGGGWLSPEEIEEGWPYEGTYLDADGNSMQGRYRLKTKPEVLHAESNAIAKLAKSTNSGLGADLFVTHMPCLDCAKIIYQSGISRVWYGANYRDDSGIKFLEKSGVEVKTNQGRKMNTGRYMIVTYLQKPTGKWDEVTEFKNSIRPKHLQNAKVILDFRYKKVVKNTLNKEAGFDDMVEFYKRLLGEKLTPHLPPEFQESP